MSDDAFHLTALDARRYDFGNALRGYDRARVDQFRDQVAEELERLSRANQELELKARNFHEQLKAFRERDKALNEALVSAQQLRGEIRQQAEREAQLIVREANAEAERQLQNVQSEVRRAEEELQALWRARRTYLTQLRHHLERQLGELSAAESEPVPSFGTMREAPSIASASASSPSRASSSAAAPVGEPEPPRIAARTVPGQSPFSAPMASASDVDLLPELKELTELPPRASSPTPSWLDVVDDLMQKSPESFPQLQYTQEHKAVALGNPALGLHARERIEACAQAVRKRFAKPVEAAIILGTGLGALADDLEVETVIEYRDLPNFPLSTVESHSGRLLCGTLAGRTVVAMQGRFHRYEGYTLQQVTFPVRVLRALGAGTLVVSNACGGMHPLWEPGDLMLIADHINLLGDNPLIGPNDDALGPRFPDMSEPYDAELRTLARAVAAERGITLREGVYAAVQGPNLETRAEYRFLRNVGADVVGMSTVPEVIVARHGGMRVLGLSIITDQCLPDALQPATVEHIIAVARAAEPNLSAVVRGVLEKLSAS